MQKPASDVLITAEYKREEDAGVKVRRIFGYALVATLVILGLIGCWFFQLP